MHGSASQAALGWIVAALAVAALAAQRDAPSEPPRVGPAVVAERSSERPQLRALLEGQKLDLNRASAAELMSIPGIGPKLAERIVSERARRGGYASADQVREVRGIGPKTWERLRPFLAVDQKRSIK